MSDAARSLSEASYSQVTIRSMLARVFQQEDINFLLTNRIPRRMATRFTRLTEQLTAAMRPILANAPGFRDDSETDAALSAEIMLSLCSGAARAAVKEWATTGNHAPIEAVEQRAISLVRNTIERVK